MKRHFMAVAWVGFAVACGGDDGNKPTNETKDAGVHDASNKDATVDAGAAGDASLVVKVTNAGKACTSAASCTGDDPVCEATSFTQDANPGGSCSAACSAGAECGPNGVCPVGELIAQFGIQAQVSIGVQAGSCNQACTLGQADSCRTGYICVTLNQLSLWLGGMSTDIPQLDQPICIPDRDVDAGISHDAGASADASTTDAAR